MSFIKNFQLYYDIFYLNLIIIKILYNIPDISLIYTYIMVSYPLNPNPDKKFNAINIYIFTEKLDKNIDTPANKDVTNKHPLLPYLSDKIDIKNPAMH
jgi:hypothetical protein